MGSFLTSLLALRWWCKFCVRAGLVDDPGHRKIHDRPVPLAGGFAVLTGIVVPLLLGAAVVRWNFPHLRLGHAALDYGFYRRATELTAFLIGAFAIVILGALDDKYE